MKFSSAQWTSLGLSMLAASSVALVLLTSRAPGTTERSERARNLILVWHENELKRLTFASKNGTFKLERLSGPDGQKTKGTDFALFAPNQEPADGAAVDRLISGIGFAVPERRLENGEREGYGLGKPEVSIEIAMGDATYRLSLGKNAPTPAGAAYVSMSEGHGEATFSVVSKDVAALFRMAPDDFRERALVGIGKNEIKELAFERPNGRLRLVRSELGFRIDDKERASRDALEPVFTALSRLDAKRFLPLAEAEKGRGGRAALVVSVTPADAKEKPALVELGGSCPGAPGEVIAIARSPRVRAGCVESALFAALGFEREALRDPFPFTARADEVETLRIERAGRRLVLTRRGSAFLLREPSEAAVELEAGNERLGAVLHAPAELVKEPDPKKLGLEPPEGRVVVTRIGEHDKAVEETLLVGRAGPDGTLYVRRDDGAVLGLGRDAARAFAVDTTLLRSLRVVDFALSSLAELELSTPEHQVLRRAPTGFELAEPKGFQHDGSLATDAVLALGSLTALRFVADADDGTFGLEKPTLTALARHDADGGAHSVRLVVGRTTPGGFFAKLDASPSVFIVERTAAERLGTLLVDRSAFMADPKTLARVTITKEGVTRTLERKHEELVPAASSGIDPAVAARLVEAIEALRAEAAVHTGAPRPHEGFEKPTLEIRFEPLPGLGKARSFSIGASGSASDAIAESARQSTHYARAKDVNATFIIADAKLKPLFDLF